MAVRLKNFESGLQSLQEEFLDGITKNIYQGPAKLFNF